jgi:predicted SprT family Zn-dependent metalloprotease
MQSRGRTGLVMNAVQSPTTKAASATTKAASATTYRPSREQWDALQAQFHFFNAALFEGKLPEPILNMSRHAKSRGFFAPERWQRGGEADNAKTHEISLNPDCFNRDQRSIASTLVHEMAHLWQATFGKNASRGYHDKEWALKMETIGLMPSSTGAPGGKRTGKNMTHYIIEGGGFRACVEADRGTARAAVEIRDGHARGVAHGQEEGSEQTQVFVSHVQNERMGEAEAQH